MVSPGGEGGRSDPKNCVISLGRFLATFGCYYNGKECTFFGWVQILVGFFDGAQNFSPFPLMKHKTLYLKRNQKDRKKVVGVRSTF